VPFFCLSDGSHSNKHSAADENAMQYMKTACSLLNLTAIPVNGKLYYGAPGVQVHMGKVPCLSQGERKREKETIKPHNRNGLLYSSYESRTAVIT
jgi:hypothetical protein